jgi:chromosome partitioning protein
MKIALVSSKGGVGKSSLAIALAVEGVLRGHRILLVDGDRDQATCLTWAETAVAQQQPVPTVVGLGAGMHQPDQLPRLAADYDLTLVDTPGRLGDVQRAALISCDVALIPVSPSVTETWALAPTLAVIEAARAIHPVLQPAIVLTRANAATALARAARDNLKATTLPIFRSQLGARIAWMECHALGKSVPNYAKGPAAQELKAVYDELMEYDRAEEASPRRPQDAAVRLDRSQHRRRVRAG